MNLGRLNLLLVTAFTAAALLAACDKAASPGATAALGSDADIQLPKAFDQAAGVISVEGYKLTECLPIASDPEKMACYAALGFKSKSDVPKVQALAGGLDILNGKTWEVRAPRPNQSQFQGSALLVLANVKNEGALGFRGTHISLECPTNGWGNETMQKWAVRVAVPFEMPYEHRADARGTIAIDLDGKQFKGRQSSRSDFYIGDDALGFRDALMNAKSLSVKVELLDGKTGQVTTSLPASTPQLKNYFAKYCP